MKRVIRVNAGRGLTRLLSVVVVVVALGACTPAPPSEFSASFTGSYTTLDETHIEVVGTGVSSLIGDFQFQASVEITSVDPDTGVITDNVIELLTVAGGDTLTLLNQQVSTPNPGVLDGTDTWTVTGGTGQFAGASGSGTGTHHIDTNTFDVTLEKSGTLTLVTA